MMRVAMLCFVAQTAVVLDGSFKGPCLITNYTADGSKVKQYSTATIYFNSTKITWGQPGGFSYETDYQDQYKTAQYGAAGILGPPASNMGRYPASNEYVGDLGFSGATSGVGGHLEATLDYNSQTVSGNMRWGEGSIAGSTVYSCNFSGMKRE